MVASVRHVEKAVRAECQRPRPRKLPRLRALAPPALHDLAVRVQLRDPFVLAELGDIVITVFILDRITDIGKLAGFCACLAADLPQLDAGGGVNPQAVVMRVAHQQVAFAIDAQTAGPAIAIIRRRPGRAEVTAIAIVDLKPGREIDEVQPIITVNGGGPRLHEIAVLYSFTPPDDLWLAAQSATARSAHHRQ